MDNAIKKKLELEKKLTMGKKNSKFFCNVPLDIKM
jgi:hypothetical protein